MEPSSLDSPSGVSARRFSMGRAFCPHKDPGKCRLRHVVNSPDPPRDPQRTSAGTERISSATRGPDPGAIRGSGLRNVEESNCRGLDATPDLLTAKIVEVSYKAYISRYQSFWSRADFINYALIFFQRSVTRSGYRFKVRKNVVRSVIWGNKAESLGIVEPSNNSGWLITRCAGCGFSGCVRLTVTSL